jgi:tetratricopeptide (TPR) repeat protein
VEGKIIEKTEKYIKIDYYGAGLTYWMDEIDRIENIDSPSEASREAISKSGPTTSTDKEIYYSKEHGLKIEVPKGWMVIDRNSPEKLREETGGHTAGVICIFKESSADSSPLIYIKNNLLAQDYTIEDYAEFLKGQNLKIKQASPELDIIENGHVININGNKFSRSVTRFNAPSGVEAYVYYHFLNGRMSYSIIGSLPADKVDAYKDIFERTAASVKFEGVKSDTFELADAEQLFIQGSQYFSAGQFDKAIEYHEKALNKVIDIELKTKILTMLSSSYLEKGITRYFKDKDDTDYMKAIKYAEEALKIKSNYWYALGNIATVYMNMDNLEKADFYFNEAERYANPSNSGYQDLILKHTLIKKTLSARKVK